MEARPRSSSIIEREGVRSSSGAQWVHLCERCGERMDERQCKIVCPNCGACRDCSDP
jgi:hypothetical protein